MAKQQPTNRNIQAQRSQRPEPARKPNPKPVSDTRQPYWWIGLVAAAIGAVLYANTIGHDYCLDDYGAIKENWIVKGGFQHWDKLWSTEYRFGSWASPGSLYRPLSLAMFSIEYMLAPEAPWLSHFMNIVFYALSGWVLWITWKRILSDYPWQLTAMTILLFMAHPIHTEVVANIKSRDEIVSLLGSTFALYCIWRHFDEPNKRWLLLGLVSYGMGMFAKESGFTFLAIFPLTVWFFGKKSISETLFIAAMFVIPAAIFLLIRYKVLHAQNYTETYSILDNFIVGAKDSSSRMASAFMMCGRYLQTLVMPHPLISDLGYPQMKPVTFADWHASVSALLYVGMGVWALINLPRRHFLAYAIFFYLITFSLFSNILVLIGTSYGERLLYAPSLGFAMALAWLLGKTFGLFKQENTEKPTDLTTMWVVVGFLLVSYGFKTVARNPAWNNSFDLYEADYPNSPNCAKLNYHRALEITDKGLNKKEGNVTDMHWIEEGIKAYDRAIELYPEYHDAYGSRGLSYFRKQEYEKAFTDYQVALKHRPNDAKVLSNMGFIYFLRAQRPGNQLAVAELDSAENVYRRSIKFDPRFVDARRNLGAVLAMKKQFSPAIEQWKEGLKFEPKNPTLHFYIGSAYRDMGKMDEARPWFEKAQALDPRLVPPAM